MNNHLRSLVENGSTQSVSEFLENSSVIDPKSLASALAWAVGSQNIEVVKLLLVAGADPNLLPDDNVLPLLSAAEHDNARMIRLLVLFGADVNRPSYGGDTALHWSVDSEGDTAWQLHKDPTVDTTSLLLSLGADPTKANESGVTPIDLAIKYQHTSALELMRNRLV